MSAARQGSAGAHMAANAENGWRVAAQQQAADAIDLVSDSDSDDSEDVSGSEQEEEQTWVSWFCSLRGNEFFCEVDEDYIEDDFNLSGLSSQVPYYDLALDMLLDNEPPHDVMLTDQQQELLESAAEMLYGLIHARFIITARGLASMLEKYKNADFGRCPRVLCDGQPCLPVGTSDIPGQSTTKIFCPRCEDLYFPRTEYQSAVDGAYFGTTFPHLLLMTYPMFRPAKVTNTYVPKVFGFKLHPTAYGANGREHAPTRTATRALPAPASQQQQQAGAAAAGGGGGAAAAGEADMESSQLKVGGGNGSTVAGGAAAAAGGGGGGGGGGGARAKDGEGTSGQQQQQRH